MALLDNFTKCFETINWRLKLEDNIKIHHTETECENADPTRPAAVCENAYELVYCISGCDLSTLGNNNTINKAHRSNRSQPYFIQSLCYTFRPTQPFSDRPLTVVPGSVKIYICVKCI